MVRRLSGFTALGHSPFPASNHIFFPWIHLVNIFFFLLLDPDAKPSEINGNFSVDLADLWLRSP